MPHIRFGNVSEIIMNDNDNMPAGAEGAPSPATPDATPDNSRSAVFSAIRSIFGHGGGQPADAPAGSAALAPAPALADAPAAPPPAPREPPARVVIRNCSTRRVLAMLVQQFGGEASVSGRYFAPAETDVAKIRAWAGANGLFVKESRVQDVLVLDLMMDRTKLDRPRRPYGGSRFGGGFRDEDGPDEF